MTDTIPDLKRAFLSAQVRILSSPLEPTEDWRGQSAIPADGDLPEKSIDSALAKVNTLIRQHNASAFPAPALAHVAAQIDALYWADTQPSLDSTLELQDGQISRSADLTQEYILSALPATWTEEHPIHSARTSGLETFAEGARYTQLLSKLHELSEKRATARKKIAQMMALAEMLEAFESPAQNVQRNLVQRGGDGELGKELEKMMMLIARVGGKIAEGR